MKAKSFKDLVVWQKAHSFVLVVYKLTKAFPADEKFGLTSQFRRAAVSIAANIAEGFKKRGVKDKCRFYNLAQGSCAECEYYLILAKDLNYIHKNNDELESLEEVKKILSGYISGIPS